MILILITSLSILTLVFSAFFLKDLINYKEDFETQTSYLVTAVIGFITNFFDTLVVFNVRYTFSYYSYHFSLQKK